MVRCSIFQSTRNNRFITENKRKSKNLQIEILLTTQTHFTISFSFVSSSFLLLCLNPQIEPEPCFISHSEFVLLLLEAFCSFFNSFFCFLSNIVLPIQAIVVSIFFKHLKLSFNLATCSNLLLSSMSHFLLHFNALSCENICLKILCANELSARQKEKAVGGRLDKGFEHSFL